MQAVILACATVFRNNKYPPVHEMLKLVRNVLRERVPEITVAEIKDWEGQKEYNIFIRDNIRVKRNTFASNLRLAFRRMLENVVSNF